jgi:peptide/nickel transport system substrate-binding protein
MSKLRRRSVVRAGVLGGVAASLGAPLVKRVEAADPRTLTVASTTDVDTLDPASFRTDGAYTVTTNVYDTSVGWEVAPSATVPGVSTAVPSKFIPNLAESFATEDDGATIVLKIRRDAKFPSGRPITAHSIKYMLDRGLQSPGYVRLTIPRYLRVTSQDSFIVRDDYTFVMKMPGPTPLAYHILSLCTLSVVDEVIAKANATPSDPWATDWFRRNTTGGGAYTLAKNEPGVGLVMEYNPGSWHPKPFFERVNSRFLPNESDRILLLKRGAIDMMTGVGLSPRNIKALESEPKIQVVSVPDTSCHFLCINGKKAPLDNVKLRQAINYAIPIDAMLKNLLFGYATQMKSPLPSLMPGYDPTLSPYRYDVAKAKALVQEAGLGGQPLTLELAVRVGWTTHEQAATWIQAELEKIGLKVTIVRETDAAFRQAAIGGKHMLSIEAWQSWVNDPIFHMNANFHSTSTNTNSSFYSNPTLDKLLTDNMHEPNAEKRAASVKEAQKILIDDAVWGFLWYENWTRVARKDLTGFTKRWDTFDRYRDLRLKS